MKNIIRAIFYLFISLFLISIGVGVVSIFLISRELPRLPENLGEISVHIPTEIYDDKGKVFFVLGKINRVPLEEISPHFKKAILAAEDKNFYSHHGVDKAALVRAIRNNLKYGRVVQGASTITQQLTKNLFFSFKKSYKRKLFELLIAFQFETAFEKDEILEVYCNQIYFGAGAYGVEDAARNYFGKHANDLNLSEAALLAGLPNSPSKFNPFQSMELAKNRQEYVLDRMVRNGMITDGERQEAQAAPLELLGRERRKSQGGYFVQYILKECIAEFGADAVNYGGLKIYTTLDRRLQDLATNAINEYMPELDELIRKEEGDNTLPEAALTSIEPGTGWIKAMVGGRNFSKSPYNRAVANSRQPGSGFKPFVYYTALEKLRYKPNTVIVDSPFTVKIKGSKAWTPKNYANKYAGPIIMKKALMKSINIVSAKMIVQTGVESVIETAKKCGIKSPLPKHLSIALGSCSVSPLEMASAYSVIATGGKFAEPTAIKRVLNNRGNVLKENIINQKAALNPQKTYMLIDMMKGVFEGGTAIRAKSMGWARPAIGKTGTTNDSRDAWFTGFTPTLGASVWVGYDDNRPLILKTGKGLTGSRGALPIWVNFMAKALEGEPVNDFPIPPRIIFKNVGTSTGVEDDEAAGPKLSVALESDSLL